MPVVPFKMPQPPQSQAPTSCRNLDGPALARITRRMQSAPQAPWLHGEVARRMAQRLPIIKLQPARVLDWALGAGDSQSLLQQTYTKANLSRVETVPGRDHAPVAVAAMPWWSPQRWMGTPRRVLAPEDVVAGQSDLVWANMSLHLAPDPLACFAQWHRALAVDGFLMFSTLGPGTLTSLQGLYQRQAWPPPFAPFVDMHDLGDMLVAAGFADPVMDQELVTLTWETPQAALLELRQLGGNAHSGRFAGLRTPRWHRALLQAVGSLAQPGGRVALDFELVYGHAFKPAPRLRVGGTTHVAVEDLRRMARAQRPEP